MALALVLIFSSGTYAYTYTNISGTISATADNDIACWETVDEEAMSDWDSLIPVPIPGTEILRPDASGDDTHLSYQFPESDEHWDKVDEVASDTWSTFVYTDSVSYQKDLYEIQDYIEGSGTITDVTVYFHFCGDNHHYYGDTVGYAKAVIKTNDTIYEGSEVSQTGDTFVASSYEWMTNPYTEEAWTWDEIDDLQVGVSLRGSSFLNAYCTQVYVLVDYEEDPIIEGDVPEGHLFMINPNSNYTGDLQVKVYLTNVAAIAAAYQYLNMKLYITDSVEAGETPNYRLLTLQNGEATLTLRNSGGGGSGTWTQTSQEDFEGGILEHLDTSTSPGDVILDASSGTVTDIFSDETKIASKSNLVVTGGQVKLTSNTSGTETLRPNANGTYTQCDSSGPPNNYMCVYEATADGDSTYVETAYQATETDTYNLANHSAGSGAISSVTVHTRSRDTNPSAPHWARTVIRTHNTDYFGNTNSLTTSYTDFSTTYSTNPYTDAAWTWAEIDALEAGVKQYDAGSGTVRTTQVYVEVDYSGGYDSPGMLTSTNLLSGETVEDIDSFGYNASAIPAWTCLKVQFSQDSITWYNSAGAAGGWDNLSEGNYTIGLSGLSWSGASFYYRMEFISNGTDTPVLDEVSVTHSSGYYTSGTLTSSSHDGGDITDWGTISFTLTELSETDIKFQIRTAATAGGLSSATWYGPTGTDDYYTETATAINSVHEGDRWIQYKAYFTGPGDSTPVLSSISITNTTESASYTVEIIGGSYYLVSGDSSEWDDGWSLAPEFYCEITQR